MTTQTQTSITVETNINAPVEKVWSMWTDPRHIVRWNAASEDWHSPRTENDLRVGGAFSYRMEARNGSAGFDFNGIYNSVDPNKLIEYTIEDGRNVRVMFIPNGNETKVIEIFEPENVYSLDLQQQGWQSILDNFKRYVEKSGSMDKLHFEIQINASVEKVYKTMLDEMHFAEWTSEFNPSSHFEGSWEKGSKILFLGIDEKGNTGGMVSRIAENVPNSFVSIEHLGIVQNCEEIMSGPEVEGWAGALENYTFVPMGEHTLLKVDVDSNSEFTAYFNDTWPKALNKLKMICEH